MALQPDGKFLVTGSFTKVGGVNRAGLVRFNADGTLDTSFIDPVLAGGGTYAVALQADGKVLVGGGFTSVGSPATARGRLARLNPDGSPDTDFADPALDGTCVGLAIQSDGKILAAGSFTAAGSSERWSLARFNADGTLYATFVNPELNHVATDVAVQPDGKVVVGGYFPSVGGGDQAQVDQNRLARFNPDGTRDTTFGDPVITNTVHAVEVLDNGKILAAGEFTFVGEVTRGRLARFNSDGTLDSSFVSPAIGSSIVRDLAVQSDGKILAAGTFATAGGQARANMARFMPDGTLDTSFITPGLNAAAWGVLVDSLGKVWVSGEFTAAGQGTNTRLHLARFNA
jgi:uncharacterized delta-60 repeat protein